MIPLLADHDFNERILKGLARREPAIDVVRVRHIGLSSAEDAVILERAASDGRVVLTHDRGTMAAAAHARVRAGHPMPGVFIIDKTLSLGQAIDEILLAAHCFSADECRDIVKYFPL